MSISSVPPTPTTNDSSTPGGEPSGDTTKPAHSTQKGSVKSTPWHLIVPPKTWDEAIDRTRLTPVEKRILKANKSPFRAVAISPRGAKWVVAVGHAEAIAVWRLPRSKDE